MNNGTASTGNMRPLTFEEVERVVKDLPDLFGNQPQEWMLMAPDGRVWTGDVPKLVLVLMQHHPLMNTPFRTADEGM